MKQPTARRSLALAGAVSIGLVGFALVAAYVALTLTLPLNLPSQIASRGQFVAGLPFVMTVAIAVLLALRRPGHPVGWTLGMWAIAIGTGASCSNYLNHWLFARDVPGSFALALGYLGGLAWAAGQALTLQIALIFPSGRLLSRRWRIVVWLNLAVATIVFATSVLDPGAFSYGAGHELFNPIGIPGQHALMSNASTGAGAAFIGLAVAAVASLVIRFRRAASDERQQLKWFLAGASLVLVGLTAGGSIANSPALLGEAGFGVMVLGFAALPAAIAIAILRYRLYDIDVVINRALVYGSLAVFIGVVYVGIAVGVGSLVGSGGKPNLGLSILATAVVAVGFQPLRERMQRLANRLVYGRRASPYEVLSQFSSRVAESYASEEVLSRMARVLAEGTGAERAEVWLRQGDHMVPAAVWPPSAATSEPIQVTGQLMPALDAQRAVAVRHQGELLGALTVSKRKGESLTPIEEKLLDDLAHQAGLVLKNVGLTEDLRARLVELRASRQRLVAAQDQERRRLERNLHDGAQQHLVALKVKLGLAEIQLARDPEKARQTIAQLKVDADEALDTLRDLARGIYPPLLAERGLGPALQAQARRATVPVAVEVDGIGRYPQEVESAVYFCCLEALQNVQKYAQASSASLRLAQRDGHLEFEVQDDGHGFDTATRRRGSGLQNMADRLDAVGGRFQVCSEIDHGSTIKGTIPIVKATVA